MYEWMVEERIEREFARFLTVGRGVDSTYVSWLVGR